MDAESMVKRYARLRRIAAEVRIKSRAVNTFVTLILQTLQQLRDVYGDSVDKIVQGNTSNIVFLKSTDDAMLDTLQKMSGTTHRAFIDGKNVTRDLEKLFMKNEGKVSYSMSIKEVPVIS